jgi:hypothetical protein
MTAITSNHNFAYNMACPNVSHQSHSNAETSLDGSFTDKTESDDDSIILTTSQFQRVTQFRDDIRLCKTDPERYEACVRVRDELLSEHAGVQLLAAACEHVMFTECAEYKERKRRPGKLSAQPAESDEDELMHWKQFLGIAKDGLSIKSKCLSALKTVARYWGQDVVHHYQWALKGKMYCDKLCTAARDE